MRLRTPDPPKSSIENAQQGVQDLLGAASPEAADAAGFRVRGIAEDETQVALTAPHRIFVLGLNDLLEQRGLETARSVGWRYLVTRGSDVVGAAETAQDESGSGHPFASLSQGPAVPSSAEIISRVEARQSDDREAFELRLLRVPAVYSVNLWLHGEAEDFLVPVDPTPPHLEAGTFYTPGDLLGMLRSDAAEVERDELSGG